MSTWICVKNRTLRGFYPHDQQRLIMGSRWLAAMGCVTCMFGKSTSNFKVMQLIERNAVAGNFEAAPRAYCRRAAVCVQECLNCS